MMIMSPLFKLLGTSFEDQISLSIGISILAAKRGSHFSNSAGIPSGPAAFPFLNLEIALFISETDGGLKEILSGVAGGSNWTSGSGESGATRS